MTNSSTTTTTNDHHDDSHHHCYRHDDDHDGYLHFYRYLPYYHPYMPAREM